MTPLNSFHSKSTPVVAMHTTASPAARPEGTPSGAHKLIFEGSGAGTTTIAACNRQNFAGHGTCPVSPGVLRGRWLGKRHGHDGHDQRLGVYGTDDGTGACRESADMFSSYPELRTGASADEFLTILRWAATSWMRTCRAFAGAFGAAKDFTFTIRRGVDRVPIPKFDYSQGSPGSAGSQEVTLSWSLLKTVIPQ